MAEEKEAKTEAQPENQPKPEAKPDHTSLEIEKLLETEKKRSQEFLTRLQYLQADYENQRKRFERETDQIKSYCSERIVTQLLDVVDEMELAIKAGKSADASQKALLDGVEMTYRKLRKVLEQEGVTPIECTGRVFDPRCYDAIAAEERDDVKECTVIDEIRKGYLLRDKVLRPAVVRVAKPKSK
jgi:Molecular chaperone GrpE (heat shock protein)